MDYVEVDQQSDLLPAQSKVREQLCIMEGRECIDCFQFENHLPLDQKIDAIAAIDEDAIVDYRQFFLSFDDEPGTSDFLLQARLVCGLQQAWS